MFKEFKVKIPDHDCDVVLTFPGGKQIVVQSRPSNADVGYPGSLDIILPEDQWVTNWEGDNMKPAKAARRLPHSRFAKQLMMTLPCPVPEG